MTKLFAIGVLVLQVIIAIGAMTMAVTVFLGMRKAELAMLTWCGHLLLTTLCGALVDRLPLHGPTVER